MAESILSMKLLINSQTNKVLFAEAGKECVDFLFHILSLPLATVIRLLQEQGMVGCLSNLYESVENLNETYIQPGKDKDDLLKPIETTSVPLFRLQGAAQETEKPIYRCSTEYYCSSPNSFSGSDCCKTTHYSDDQNAICPRCNRQMTYSLTYVAPLNAQVVRKVSNEGGFVKGVVTYMVMDDLVVKPMSTISSLTLLNKFNVKDISALKAKEVHLGLEQAVKLLKTCLHSKEVLTAVFLNNS